MDGPGVKAAVLLLAIAGAVLPARAGEAAGADAASAEKARQVFESLYAEKVARVRATLDPADDLELARTLLEAARTT